MNKKFTLSLVSSVLIIIVLVTAYFLMNMAKTTTVYVDPDKVAGSAAQDFTVDVSISNVANLYAWECRFGWNATVLDLVNVTEGSFLKKMGATFFDYGLNETFGHMVIDCTLLGNVAGANGSGVLVSIRLNVKNKGTSQLALYDTKLLDAAEQMIVHTVNGGHFSADV